MPPDVYLREKIQKLRDDAIKGTSVFPDIPPEVEAVAMTLAYDEACAYMAQHGYPVDGLMAPPNDARIMRKPPRASWVVSLFRHQRDGESSWQFIATCDRIPKASDLDYLALMKSLLGIPPKHPMTVSDDWPGNQQQHFIWLWPELGTKLMESSS